MVFRDGAIYTVRQLYSSHPDWSGVERAIRANTHAGSPRRLLELYEVKWRAKPFPWSWLNEFKPNRRFFFHGTSVANIQSILDGGFRIMPAVNGKMLGNGVYFTFHTNKSCGYAPDGYVISAMVYAPNTLVVHPGYRISYAEIQAACLSYDAIEVRTGAIICYPGQADWAMQNHEICIFDTRRVVPRFISLIGQ